MALWVYHGVWFSIVEAFAYPRTLRYIRYGMSERAAQDRIK
jgi:hypothetical protein